MWLLLAACSPPPTALPPIQPHAEGVEMGGVVNGVQWGAVAAAVELAQGQALAADVAVVQAPNGKPALGIQAQSSAWDMQSHSVHFEGNVVMTRADVVIHCSALDVRYGVQDRIEQVIATGPIQMTKGSRHAEADHAELLVTTGELLLTGNPRLSEGKNTLEGQRIRVFLDAEKVICEGAEGQPCNLRMEGELQR